MIEGVFDRRVWCACHTVELADEDDLIGDAADDQLVHGAATCVRTTRPAVPHGW